jgi:hypothetical protein
MSVIENDATPETAEAPLVEIGEVINVEDPLRGVSISATVVESGDDAIGLRLPAEAEWRFGRVGLRRYLSDGRAWYAETVCRPGPAGGPDLVAAAPDAWDSDAVRHSVRFPAFRAPVVCETYPPNAVKRDLAALDISAGGLGATGHGPALAVGTPVQVTLDPAGQRWVNAVVVWSAPAAYGHCTIGFRFVPESRADQDLILAWRNAVASRQTAE